jgi:hypothetical protein
MDRPRNSSVHCQWTVSQLAWSHASIAGVTVNVVKPLIAPDVAVIVVEPPPAAVASPALLIVATAAADEFHVTLPVMLLVELSLNVPVAVNCSVLVSVVAEGPAGVTAIEERVGAGGSPSSLLPPPQPAVDSTSSVAAT